MICNDENARRDKREGREADNRPAGGEILKVNYVAQNGEDNLGKREGVGEIEQSMQSDYGLW